MDMLSSFLAKYTTILLTERIWILGASIHLLLVVVYMHISVDCLIYGSTMKLIVGGMHKICSNSNSALSSQTV